MYPQIPELSPRFSPELRGFEGVTLKSIQWLGADDRNRLPSIHAPFGDFLGKLWGLLPLDHVGEHEFSRGIAARKAGF